MPPSGSVSGDESGLRKGIIATAVVIHFLLTVLVMAPYRSPISSIPGLSRVLDVYAELGLAQGWQMFAPPPRHEETLYYSVLTDKGWTDPVAPLGPYLPDLRKAVLPRGHYRMSMFFEVNGRLDQERMTPSSYRAFYYQQLADYYCAGDGRIPGARAIRFSLVRRTLAPFYEERPRPGGAPPPPPPPPLESFPLYEQEC